MGGKIEVTRTKQSYICSKQGDHVASVMVDRCGDVCMDDRARTSPFKYY